MTLYKLQHVGATGKTASKYQTTHGALPHVLRDTFITYYYYYYYVFYTYYVCHQKPCHVLLKTETEVSMLQICRSLSQRRCLVTLVQVSVYCRLT